MTKRTAIRNDDFLKAFGARIRDLRNEKGICMENLSDACEVEYSQISRIETGRINTSVSMAVVLADALDISLKELFNFEGKG